MKRWLSAVLGSALLFLLGCGLFPDYSMSPTGDGVYEFGKPEIGIYFTYTRGAESGLMTAENQTDISTAIRIQRKYDNGEWGRGKSFTLGKQASYKYSEYYPKGTPLRITIKRDAQEWVLRVDLD